MHLTPAQVTALTQPPVVTSKTVAIEDGKQVPKSDSTQLMNHGVARRVHGADSDGDDGLRSILAQEIATEKGSRIMEILLSSVSATTQFFGKLAGIFALLLTQLAIYLVAGLIGWQFLKNQSMVAGVLKQFDFSILFSRDYRYDRDFLCYWNTNIFGVSCFDRFASFQSGAGATSCYAD